MDRLFKYNSNDASCLGQLSGLNENRVKYNSALEKLRNQDDTTMMLVARPTHSSIYEIQRAQQNYNNCQFLNSK